MNPFPLSSDDYNAFISAVGLDNLGRLPQWGGVIQWSGRYVLVYQKPDGTYTLTDITGGIPDDGVPGGFIPPASIVKNIPTEQTSTLGVFLYSLFPNFLQVAKEDAIAVAQGAASVAGPLVPTLGFGALIVVGVLAFIYLPRPKG